MTAEQPTGRRSRREEILDVAVELFARRGYHGVSMDEIGKAAGVTGPALYHHFSGKEAMVAAALIPVSEQLLAGGQDRIETAGVPAAALDALLEFHVTFALEHPAVITLHLHELDRLPEEPRREIRRLQRLYVEEWVEVLCQLRPELKRPEARVLAHAAFGLMNSTPFIGAEIDQGRRAELLRAATRAALLV
jgi:AcrR family transcriptional regulator